MLQAYFCDYFKDNEAISQIDWDTWYYAPGGCRCLALGHFSSTRSPAVACSCSSASCKHATPALNLRCRHATGGRPAVSYAATCLLQACRW